ncbi:MAG: hypothetical protein HUK15_02835 [Bacteroidales bacterium]|nr:hypothetical protein [Bacteroidales bacterium]
MLEKFSKIFGWVVLAFAVVVSVLFFVLPSESAALQSQLDALEGQTGEAKIAGVDMAAQEWGGFIVSACEFMSIAAALMFVGFALFNIVMNGIAEPKSLIKPAIVVVGAVCVVVLSMALANGAAPETIGIQKLGYTANEVYSDIKLSEAGIWATYITGGLVMVALIFGAVSKLWK